MQVQTLRLITAVLAIVFFMLYMHTNSEKRYYSKTAEPAVEKIMAEISTWQEEPLLRHLAPEAKETITDEQLKQLLDQYREFGWFYSVSELNFSRTASVFSLFGDKRINYSGLIDYSTGSVSLNITLVERDGFFLVYNFSLARVTD
ncbi:MAG: hypothetical protein KDF59_02940 [Nitrosomonas sp.]|nr:hypothetical protein [Nitrosomonas sp.]